MPGKRAVQRRTPTVQSERVMKKANQREMRERNREREAYTKFCVSELLPYAELILKLTWQRFKRTGNKARETKRGRERRRQGERASHIALPLTKAPLDPPYLRQSAAVTFRGLGHIFVIL